MPILDIFIRSFVRQTRSYARLKSKNVAMVRRCWADINPSEMNCDSRRYWSVALRPFRKPACLELRAECTSSHNDRRFSVSLSKTFPVVEVSAIGRYHPTSAGSFPFIRKGTTYAERQDFWRQLVSQLLLRIFEQRR